MRGGQAGWGERRRRQQRPGLRVAAALLLTAAAFPVAADGQRPPTRHEGQAATGRRFDQRTGRWSAPFTATGDSVMLAYAFATWRAPWVPESFLIKGDKADVDQGFLPLVTLRQGKGREDPWKALGQGLRVDDYLDDYGAEFYLGGGARLIALEGPRSACDTLILSAVSKHVASPHTGDFARLRTESGVGLGDPQTHLLKRLGTPSRRDRFQEYTILWYLQKPKHVVIGAGTHEYDEGHAAAYALKGGRVVEIWLHEWDNEPIG